METEKNQEPTAVISGMWARRGLVKNGCIPDNGRKQQDFLMNQIILNICLPSKLPDIKEWINQSTLTVYAFPVDFQVLGMTTFLNDTLRDKE